MLLSRRVRLGERNVRCGLLASWTCRT